MRSIAADVAAAAEKFPDRVALRGQGGNVTYGELLTRIAGLAAALRERGVGAETRVGIHLRRSPELIVAILSVLACGATYVPLDPDHPASRLETILDDAGVALLLGTDESASLGASVPLLPARDWPRRDSLSLVTPAPGDAVYVLYTSGSTGAPKGVVVEYGALANYLEWCLEALPATGGGAPLFATVAFDHAVTVLYPSLMRGEPLKLLPPIEAGRALASGLLDGTRYSYVKITPSHLRLLTAEQRAELGRSADLVMLGGESAPVSLVSDLRRDDPALAVMNHYGPTEATVGCCVYRIPPHFTGPVIPIGRPIPGNRADVRDGELLIGGAGLAREYWRRPDLTARAFVVDPDGRRWYRTGDHVKRDSDGLLYFAGRIDDQVKVLGHRVELGEIECVLRAMAGVTDAAVVAREKEGTTELIAAVVSPARNEAALRNGLRATLPAAMVPSRIVFLDALPVRPTGKLDRDAVIAASRMPSNHANGVEERLLQRWKSTLGVDAITADDDFFDIGGDSLHAVVLIEWASEAFDVPLDLAALFETPTVRLLAARIRELRGD